MEKQPHKQPGPIPETVCDHELGAGRAATLDEVVKLSRMTPALAVLDSAALERIAALARVHVVPAGTRILKRGDPGRSLCLVLDGRTIAVTSVRATPHVLELHEPGAFFGEIAALVRVPRQVDVIAVQPTTLLELPRATLPELLDHPAARALVIEVLLARCERIRQAIA